MAWGRRCGGSPGAARAVSAAQAEWISSRPGPDDPGCLSPAFSSEDATKWRLGAGLKRAGEGRRAAAGGVAAARAAPEHVPPGLAFPKRSGQRAVRRAAAPPESLAGSLQCTLRVLPVGSGHLRRPYFERQVLRIFSIRTSRPPGLSLLGDWKS